MLLYLSPTTKRFNEVAIQHRLTRKAVDDLLKFIHCDGFERHTLAPSHYHLQKVCRFLVPTTVCQPSKLNSINTISLLQAVKKLLLPGGLVIHYHPLLDVITEALRDDIKCVWLHQPPPLGVLSADHHTDGWLEYEDYFREQLATGTRDPLICFG
jgi:hypothetical protein